MLTYVIHRLWHGLLVLAGVSLLVFGLTYLGGDPATALLPLDTPPEAVAQFRHQAGLDRPLVVQYLDYLRRAIQGDFGQSLRYREPALSLVLERLPATLRLTGVGLAFALLIALPVGIVSAWQPGSALDRIGRIVVLLGQSVPGFWLAIVLIWIFAVGLRWLPASGAEGPGSLILPGLTVASFGAAAIARLLRSSLLDVLRQDYLRTARAKGLAPTQVIAVHALRNAAIPVLTLITLQLGSLLGGAVITEVIFAYPGIGRLAVQAIANRDLPLIQAFVAVTATLIVLLNIGLDLAYMALDPRLREGRRVEVGD